MNALLFTAAIALALPLTSLAADKSGTFTVLGIGNDSCGSFISAAQKGSHQEDWSKWNLYTSYAVGYFTAVNLYEEDTKDILGNTDIDGVMANIEKYCKANPLKSFRNAIGETAFDLYPSRKR